ncbi:GNAT family N-acetyltransferase [Robertkochia aurantiaca]|uniref:GNAT family N-acetyltransferase n=1 Tax=Robertkochia aurantiaca TaxID=2873700 RepID=UPI001CCFE1D3|nr:GNAT family N-acetyltransferase [Robertkochia sp. 3YJGBD-33]
MPSKIKPLIIERCGEEDLEVLQRFSSDTFREAFEKQNIPEDFERYMKEAFSMERLKSELNTRGSEFYFCYAGAERIGYFKINMPGAQSDLEETDALELERIYVIGAFQGLGYGTKLLDRVVQMAWERGLDYLWLGVWEHNTRAIELYKRYGFKKTGEHPYAIGTDIQTDWIMRFKIR